MIVKMILTNAFDPDPRVYKEAITLVKNGHDVEILAWDRERKFINSPFEIKEGIKIRRFFSTGKYGSGIKQVFGYLNFSREIIKYLNVNKFDYIHCHDFDGLLIGRLLKIKNKNFKLVYDEHDLFYLYFENRGRTQSLLLSKLVKKIELLCLRKVNYHIVVTPNMKRLYENITKSIVITNAPLKSSFKTIEKTKRKKIIIGFIGAVRYFNELKVLIDTSSKYENMEVFIAGKGTKLDEIKGYVAQKGYNHVRIFGQYHIDQLEELYSQIDITYLVYPSKDAKISLPNKFFESIVTETPMIAYEKSEFGEIIKRNSLGWTISSQNLEDRLSEVLKQINKNNSIQSYKLNIKNNKEYYYWESNIDKLLKIYNS
jgi:glycosyltransferase involved in cell wall biosynthesis